MQKKNLSYKSDFKITERCDAGYAMRFRFLYYVGSPSKAYVASFDGKDYTNCYLNEDGTLTVCFDDHGLGIGDLMVERHYYFGDEQFESGVCDISMPAAPVVVIDKDAPTLSKLFEVVLSTKGLSYLECYAVVEPYWMLGGYGEAAYAAEEDRKVEEAHRVVAENLRVMAENKRANDWKEWFGATKTSWTQWFDETKDAVSTWFSTTKESVSTWFETSKSDVTAWFSATKGAWNTWFADTKNSWTNWFDPVKSAWSTFKANAEKWLNDTKSAWTTWFDATKSGWTTWYNTNTSAWTTWFGNVKTEWTTLKNDATAATSAANTATGKANTATANATAATTACTTATANANKATSDANAATAVAIAAADTAKNEAQNAKAIATDASNVNEQSKVLVAEMAEGLEAQQIATANAEAAAKSAQNAAALAAQSSGSIMIRPTGMSVVVPKVVTIGSFANLEVSMQPASAYCSKVFQSWQGCRVAPDGRAEFTEVGTAVVYVIPSLNDTIAQRVEVTVRDFEALQAENGSEMIFENGESIAI